MTLNVAERAIVVYANPGERGPGTADRGLGRFDAEFLLDFFAGEIGAYFYNRGLYAAQAILSGKLGELGEAIYQLERPTEFHR